jgi:hypothetical protein
MLLSALYSSRVHHWCHWVYIGDDGRFVDENSATSLQFYCDVIIFCARRWLGVFWDWD